MNTPHKHAELIKAWADGAEIEARAYIDGGWSTWTGTDTPTWNGTALTYEFRIKPQPDVVKYVYVMNAAHETFMYEGFHEIPNIKLTFDGETNKLKSAEVLE